MPMVNVWIDDDVLRALKVIAQSRDTYVPTYLREFLSEYGHDEWIPEADGLRGD